MREALKPSIGTPRRSSAVGPIRVAITAMVVAAGLSGPMSPASAASSTVAKPGADSSLRSLHATSHPAGAAKTQEAATSRVLAGDDEAEGELAAEVPELVLKRARVPNFAAAGQSLAGALGGARAAPHVAA